jgi:hypothetical protein
MEENKKSVKGDPKTHLSRWLGEKLKRRFHNWGRDGG